MRSNTVRCFVERTQKTGRRRKKQQNGAKLRDKSNNKTEHTSVNGTKNVLFWRTTSYKSQWLCVCVWLFRLRSIHGWHFFRYMISHYIWRRITFSLNLYRFAIELLHCHQVQFAFRIIRYVIVDLVTFGIRWARWMVYYRLLNAEIFLLLLQAYTQLIWLVCIVFIFIVNFRASFIPYNPLKARLLLLLLLLTLIAHSVLWRWCRSIWYHRGPGL